MRATESQMRSSNTLGASLAIAVAACTLGCAGTRTPGDASATRPAECREIDTSHLTEQHDKDRVALARFVGAWDFEGWYDPSGESRRSGAGMAAGVVEHDNFLLLDTANFVDQDGEREFETGSLLFSVEPGVGLVMTAWSDDSKAVHRFRGRVEAEGSRFVFEDIPIGGGRDRVAMVMRFETDDRWFAEGFRRSRGSDTLVAQYTFTRAP